MAKKTDYERIVLRSLRATARFLGSVLFLMIIMFAIGEGIPNPFALSLAEAITFFSFIIMLGGLILAWRMEGIGGLVVLFGYFVFVILNPFSFPGGIIFMFPLTGILFVIYWWITKTRKRHDKA